MADFFLIIKEGGVIKLDKGITEAKVNELLGATFKIEPVKNEAEQKRVYYFKNTNRNTYRLLLRNGILEWVMQISQ